MRAALGAVFAIFLMVFLYQSCGAQNIQLSAETSRPELSVFIPGEKIVLAFSVSGLPANDSSQKLELKVVDESEHEIAAVKLPITADAQGKGYVEYNAPNKKFGFYRIYAALSNGTSLSKLRSRPEGFVTYCIVPDPANRQLYPSTETFFGMQGGFNSEVNVLPYLGIRWVLGGYAWGDFESDRSGQFAESRKAAKAANTPLPGPSDFSWAKVTKNGKVQPWTVYKMPTLFMRVPKWAAIPETAAYSTAALTPEGEKGWYEYCREVGKALKTDAPNLSEYLVQITWEPVYPWGYKGTSEQLIKIHEIAYKALHEANPKIKVLGPTGAGIDRGGVEWNLQLMKTGIGKYIDGLAIHPYHAVPPEREGYITNIRNLKEGLLQIAGHPVKIYGTEQGKATNENTANEIIQALGLIRQNLIIFGEGAQINFAFYIVDYLSEPGYGFFYNLNPNMDWGTNKFGPKPVAPAYAAMTYLLEGHKSTGAIEWLGETAWGYAFERGNDIVLAVWDYGDAPREVSVPVGVKKVTVYDWMGNPTVLDTPNGIAKVSLTQKPLYIRGAAAKLWGSKAKQPLKLNHTRVTVFAGSNITIAGTAAISDKALKGYLEILPNEELGTGRIRIPLKGKAGKSIAFSKALKISPATRPGTYSINIGLVNGIEPVTASAVVLTVAPPVSIQSVRPVKSSTDDTSIIVSVQNQQKQAYTGSVQLSIKGVPESRKSVKVNIPGNSKQDIKFSYTDLAVFPERTYTVSVKVAGNIGSYIEKSFSVDFLSAVKATKNIEIDGNLDEWNGLPIVILKGSEFCVRSKEYFDPELQAELRYLWNSDALYLAVQVQDRKHIQDYDGYMTWKGDCLQVAFNVDYGKVQQKTGNVLADTAAEKLRICEIDLALTKNGPEAYRTMTFDEKNFPVALLSRVQLPLAVVREGDYTIYEAAIPWTTLGLKNPPTTGQSIGTAITVNDMNSSSQLDPSALGLFGGIAGSKNPDKYGTLLIQ